MFTGFTTNSLEFLSDIETNNNKTWFETNRQRYEQHLLGPLRALVTDLGDMMSDIDPAVEIRPAVNKTISRIYRDTRFSKDKSPYRACVWIAFKRPRKDWSSTECGFFFELKPRGYRYGMGFYQAAPSLMREIRGLIDEDPQAIAELIAPLSRQRTFELVGEQYKKPLGEDLPHGRAAVRRLRRVGVAVLQHPLHRCRQRSEKCDEAHQGRTPHGSRPAR